MKQSGDKTTRLDLEKSWTDTLSNFDLWIKNGGKLRPIRFLIRHIIDKKYSSKFYAGSSMYSLLISIPNEMTIDFTRTLKIAIDQRNSTVEFRYQIELPRPKKTYWVETCQLTEIIDTFEYFVQKQRLKI